MVMDIVIYEISMVKVWSWRLHGSNCGLHFEEYSYLIIHLCITVTVTWILLSNTKKKKTILAGHLYPVFSFFISLFFFSNQMPESNLGFGILQVFLSSLPNQTLISKSDSNTVLDFLCPCNAAKIYNTTLLTLYCLLFRPFIGYMVWFILFFNF